MLNFDWRPPVVWVEWSEFFLGSTWDKMEGFLLAEVKYKLLLLIFFAFNCIVKISSKILFQDSDVCTQNSEKLFKAAQNLGYTIYEPRLPLTLKPGCENKYHTDDILLIQHSQKQNV